MKTDLPDLMIDIETLGLRPDAVIFELAAVAFDPTTGDHGQSFKAEINIEDAYLHRLTSDEETRRFWDERGGPRQGEAQPLRVVLDHLAGFIGDMNPKAIWSWGSDFDFPILGNAYLRAGLDCPWRHYQQRDARTVYKLVFPEEKRRGIDHNALNDCLRQIKDIAFAINYSRSI